MLCFPLDKKLVNTNPYIIGDYKLELIKYLEDPRIEKIFFISMKLKFVNDILIDVKSNGVGYAREIDNFNLKISYIRDEDLRFETGIPYNHHISWDTILKVFRGMIRTIQRRKDIGYVIALHPFKQYAEYFKHDVYKNEEEMKGIEFLPMIRFSFVYDISMIKVYKLDKLCSDGYQLTNPAELFEPIPVNLCGPYD